MDQPNSDLEPTAQLVETANSSPEIMTPDSPTGFAITGKKITNWTSNLIASAMVAIIALVAGSHLVSSLSPLSSQPDELPIEAELNEAWPVLESCALQFGNSNVELQRDTINGTRGEVIEFLQAKCREVLQQDNAGLEAMRENEAQLATQFLETQSMEPVEQHAGHWRIFHVENPKISSPLPMVIGVRDNGTKDSLSSNSENKTKNKTKKEPASRLAVWGLALPQAASPDGTNDTTDDTIKTPPQDDPDAVPVSGTWTSFVGRSAVADELNQLKDDLIPVQAQRTLAIAGGNGDSLIGFSGGKIADTTRFFDGLASKRSWKTAQPWHQSADSWTTSYELPKDSPARGIQVQLSLNHNQGSHKKSLRGILIIRAQK